MCRAESRHFLSVLHETQQYRRFQHARPSRGVGLRCCKALSCLRRATCWGVSTCPAFGAQSRSYSEYATHRDAARSLQAPLTAWRARLRTHVRALSWPTIEAVCQQQRFACRSAHSQHHRHHRAALHSQNKCQMRSNTTATQYFFDCTIPRRCAHTQHVGRTGRGKDWVR